MSWQEQARCRGVDTARFFSDAEGRDALYRMRPTAQEMCAACPVIEQCAEWADDRREAGLWAGSFRTSRVGPYTRKPLIPGAPLFELRPKMAEASVGTWVA